jgi:plasmid stabilization system protein ParE
MKRYRVVITPFAADNIREAHEWLMAENPIYAAEWLDGIKDKILGLETLPQSHALAPESGDFDDEIRQLLFGRRNSWRIFFTVEGTSVHILHVRHGRRDDWRR